MLFAAYNLASPEQAKHPAFVLPLGTIFILKEPLLKTGLRGDFLLRTDSPSDVIILNDNHRLFGMTRTIKWKNKITLERTKKPCTAEDWKKQGNEYFSKKNYLSALSSYLSAVKALTSTEDQLRLFLYLNISATYLSLEYFELSQEYALKALTIDPTNVKGLYRAGCAHYALRQFELSKSYFEKLVSVQPENSEGISKLQKALKRLNEMTGKINIAELYNTSKMKPKTHIDCADYVGSLKITSSSDEQQAVHATEDIKPGTLILASKALICVFSESDLPFYINSNEPFTPGEIGRAVQEACQLLYKNPKIFGAALYDLPIGEACFDVTKPKPFCDETCQEPNVDVEHIRQILTRNNLKFELVSGCALFHVPSFINHCCLANANWTIYNNIMVVHAIKHIKAGEEITISCINPLIRYSLKEIDFNERKLKCNCCFCKSERSVPVLLRVEIENQYFDMVKSEAMAANGMEFFLHGYLIEMRRSIEKIEELIKIAGFKELRYHLAIPYFTLSTAYASVNHIEDARRTLWKAIYALGFDTKSVDSWSKGQTNFPLPKTSLFDLTLLNFIQVLIMYSSRLELHTEASKYMRALEVGHAIYQGANRQMVLETYNQ